MRRVMGGGASRMHPTAVQGELVVVGVVYLLAEVAQVVLWITHPVELIGIQYLYQRFDSVEWQTPLICL